MALREAVSYSLAVARLPLNLNWRDSTDVMGNHDQHERQGRELLGHARMQVTDHFFDQTTTHQRKVAVLFYNALRLVSS